MYITVLAGSPREDRFLYLKLNNFSSHTSRVEKLLNIESYLLFVLRRLGAVPMLAAPTTIVALHREHAMKIG